MMFFPEEKYRIVLSFHKWSTGVYVGCPMLVLSEDVLIWEFYVCTNLGLETLIF